MNTTKKTPGQIAYEASKTFVLAWDDTPSNLKEAFEASALAVLAGQWRPVTEPPEDERDRVFVTTNGTHSGCTWFYNRDSVRTHWMPIPPIPQPPIDPYAELKAAHAAGKVIQCLGVFGDWAEIDRPVWNLTPSEYRIKPWTLSRHLPGFRALEPGEKWHRNDFTEEMLPEWWRPLLLGEQSAHGDEAMWSHKPDEFTVQELSCITEEENYNLFWRTTRPLPPTKQELESEEFETWWRQEPSASIQDLAWSAWQAARATAKPNP